MYFEYSDKEMDYLKKRDKRLGEAIEKIGYINREVEVDLFSSIIHHIIGQQISVRAQATIWQRLIDKVGEINADTIYSLEVTDLQKFGMTFKKAEYIRDFAEKVRNNEFDINELELLSDAEVIKKLSALKGIGMWTAEMLLTFCMQRPDIVSFGDLAIHRGMRMLYHHKGIDKEKFTKYKKRYSPYGTVASLYLWAIAGGAIPEMKGYAPKKNK
ncbi:MAG: DNA-3-methyladenine glycosylase 2 family protein [Mobilitalea sp.]